MGLTVYLALNRRHRGTKSFSHRNATITHRYFLQEIISEEIVDETDRYEDNQSKRRAKRMTTSAVMRGSVKLHHHHLSHSSSTKLKFRRIVERHKDSLVHFSGERSPLLGGSPPARPGPENFHTFYDAVTSESPLAGTPRGV